MQNLKIMWWKGARWDNEIWKKIIIVQNRRPCQFMGLISISCLRILVVKSRLASLCLAFEVMVENYIFGMEGFFFEPLSNCKSEFRW